MSDWTRNVDEGASPSRAPAGPPSKKYKDNFNKIDWTTKDDTSADVDKPNDTRKNTGIQREEEQTNGTI